MGALDCLIDCDAVCCKNQRGHRIQVVFDFTEAEAEDLQARGTILRYSPKDEGYIMEGDQCSELKGRFCQKHGLPSQPECCANNKAGGDLCMAVRRAVIEKRRWSEVE